MTKYSVCVMGLGTVGLPAAVYFQRLGCDVSGYDVSPRAVANARVIAATCDIDEIPKDTEVFVVCVSTMQSGDRPITSSVYDACLKISQGFNPRLVSIESTVPIGTCRDIHKSILKGRINLSHVPHRYWPQDPQGYGVLQLRVAGAVNISSAVETRNFYSGAGIPLVAVEPIEIAEMSKIVENAYRYVQIAFAEEMKLICDRNNLNFNTLRNACNSKWNVEIPEARDGIGGTCLPKDIRYVIDAAKRKGLESDLLLSAIRADKKYVEQHTEQMVYA